MAVSVLHAGIMDKSLLGYNDRFRHGLSFMYFVTVNNKTGALKSLRLKATRIKNLRVRAELCHSRNMALCSNILRMHASLNDSSKDP